MPFAGLDRRLYDRRSGTCMVCGFILPRLGRRGRRGGVGRRVELTIEADNEGDARTIVERLASELFSNPLIESFAIEWVDIHAGAGR